MLLFDPLELFVVTGDCQLLSVLGPPELDHLVTVVEFADGGDVVVVHMS